jgi:hypothetical protein
MVLLNLDLIIYIYAYMQTHAYIEWKSKISGCIWLYMYVFAHMFCASRCVYVSVRVLF